MSNEVRVPELGESVVSAVIASWLKHEGDAVNPGDALVELETDKVNVEVSAEQGGVLQKIIKQVGEEVNIGDVLALVGDATGTQEQQEQPGQPEQKEQRATPTPVLAAPATNGDKAPVSPLAQKVAADNNVDLAQVKGSSAHGRVIKADVMSYVENAAQTPAMVATPSSQANNVPARSAVPSIPATTLAPAAQLAPKPAAQGSDRLTVSAERREERIRMSRRRQTIAQRLVEAQHTAAMLTTFNEIDMSAIMEVRTRRKESFKERHNVSLGFMSFFTKAVVGALKAFPRLKAEIQGNEMILKHYYDIGIAVGAEEGLVVPVLRDADRKSFDEIEREIADLAKRARENTLTLADLQGGTFTLTNGGVFGSLLSTPILNGPQVGILGMNKIEQRPVVVNGQIAARPMMYVAVSYDHRIVDGREAVQFLVRVKELLEDPETLLLEG